MCGIAGFVSSNPEVDKRSKIVRMISKIVHRGPDDEGIYEDNNACLGHRRLSIIDLSAAGHQPMVDGKNVLILNGEIYNFTELRKELEIAGIKFQSHSDTEVLLRGYRAWGDRVVSKIQGMFAFALWDGEKQRLFCARDPFGKKPFYYHYKNRKFIFASEIEALISGLDARPDLDYPGLSHYLLKGYFAPGFSVYKGVHTLKAGSILVVDARKGELCEKTYSQGKFNTSFSPLDGREHVLSHAQQLLSNAVIRRFQSDVPVGVLLSGGVDSSLVSMLSAEVNPSNLRTFTATFSGTSFNEAHYASQVASRIGAMHNEIEIPTSSIAEILPRLVKAYGEPFGDYSAIPTFCLFEGLKPLVKVALTGDGGDEVFAGYKEVQLFLLRDRLLAFQKVGRYFGKSLPDFFVRSRWKKVRELGFGLTALRPSGHDAFYALNREGWTRYWRQRFLRAEAWDLTGGELVEQEERLKFFASGQDDLQRYLNLSLERLTQDFLVKIDRASMAHSIEARSPFLDVEIFDWTSHLPMAVLLKRGEQKSILKDLLASRMNFGFARRTKMGFTPPLGEIFRNEKTAVWLENCLVGKGSFVSTLFPSDAIRQLINLHLKGHDHTGRLWKLLFLNQWHAQVYCGAKVPDESVQRATA